MYNTDIWSEIFLNMTIKDWSKIILINTHIKTIVTSEEFWNKIMRMHGFQPSIIKLNSISEWKHLFNCNMKAYNSLNQLLNGTRFTALSDYLRLNEDDNLYINDPQINKNMIKYSRLIKDVKNTKDESLELNVKLQITCINKKFTLRFIGINSRSRYREIFFEHKHDIMANEAFQYLLFMFYTKVVDAEQLKLKMI